MQIEVGKPQKKYELTLTEKETGEILYQNESYSGMFCTVEEIKSFGADIEGTHQVGGWGHPMAQWYALDQLIKWFKLNEDVFIDTLIQNGIIKGDVESLKNMFKK